MIPARPDPSHPRTLRERCLLGVALVALAVLTAIIYWPLATRGEFIAWDDGMFVTNNPVLAQGLTWETVGWAFGNNLFFFQEGLEYFSPLTALSRLCDVTLFGADNAPAFHRTNILLHQVNILLLFSALALLTRRPWLSWLVALIFTLHPYMVESVSWLSARKDLVYGASFFLAVLAYGWYARRPGWPRYLLLLGAFILACMSKPMSVTLSCTFLLLDVWPLGRLRAPAPLFPALRDPQWRAQFLRLLLEKAPFFILSLGVAWLAFRSQLNYKAIVPLESMSTADRGARVATYYIEYLGRFFSPVDMAALHPILPAPALLPVLGSLLLLGAVCVLPFTRWGARVPWLFTGWFWFVGILFPVSGILQIGNARISERYMYVPLVGLAILLVWGGEALVRRLLPQAPRIRTFAAVLLALWLAWLGVLAKVYAATWVNTAALSTRHLELYPGTWTFRQAHSTALLQAGNYDMAWSYLKEMVMAHRYVPYAWEGIARIHQQRGNKVAALAAARRSVEAESTPEAELLLGTLLLQNGDNQAAIQHLQRSAGPGGQLPPYAHYGLVRAYLIMGQPAAAEAEFEKLRQQARTNPEAAYLLNELKKGGAK